VLAVAAGEEEGAPVPLLLGVKNVVAEIEIEIGSGSILLLDWRSRSPPPPKKTQEEERTTRGRTSWCSWQRRRLVPLRIASPLLSLSLSLPGLVSDGNKQGKEEETLSDSEATMTAL
jgi:hypothetical protein